MANFSNVNLPVKLLEVSWPRLLDLISLLLHDDHAIPMPFVCTVLILALTVALIDRLARLVDATANFTRVLKSNSTGNE